MLEIPQGGMDAAQKLAGCAATRGRTCPVHGFALQEGQDTPDPSLGIRCPEPVRQGVEKPRGLHTMARKVGGDHLDIVVDLGVEDRVQTLEGEVSLGGFHEVREVDMSSREPPHSLGVEGVVTQHRREVSLLAHGRTPSGGGALTLSAGLVLLTADRRGWLLSRARVRPSHITT